MQRNIIKFGGFSGINNVMDPSDLQPTAEGNIVPLVDANDVEIDNFHKLHSRPGTELKASVTNAHSLWSNGVVALIVVNGVLKQLQTDYTMTTLQSGLDPTARMSYASTGTGRVYMSNGLWIGYYENGAVYNIPNTIEDYKQKMPPGQFVCYLNGQLFVSVEKFIYASDPLKYNQYDMRNGFIVMNSAVKLMAPVKDGLYVGDDAIWFLGGSNHLQFSRAKIIDAQPIPNSQAEVALGRVGDGSPSMGVFFSTTEGIYLGQSGGNATNLTKDRYHPMSGFWSSAIVRKNADYSQYLTAIQS
jgi:hypothetical protein